MVRVIGPVEVSGFARPLRRAVLVPILCYLACHKERTRTGAELRAALWPMGDDLDSDEAAAGTLQSYMSMLRRSLGEERVPRAAASGYRVTEQVETDFEWFERLLAAARDRPDEAGELLRTALDMVRGQPFEGADEHYEWAFSEQVVNRVEVAVVRAAKELATLELDAGRPEEAVSAVQAGLKAFPDDGLCSLWLDAAAAVDPGTLERAWRDVGHVLGDRAERLRDRYESLRKGLADLPY